MKGNSNHFTYVSIVAIIAIVAIVVLTMGNNKHVEQKVPDNSYFESNMAGQAINHISPFCLDIYRDAADTCVTDNCWASYVTVHGCTY